MGGSTVGWFAARWKVELHLPMLVIGAEDIQVKRQKKQKHAGPFLIIARACGMAFDTAHATSPGSQVILYPPHGLLHQLWYLRPAGTEGEFVIVSAVNGLAVDKTRGIDDPHPELQEPTAEPWQRWRLENAPDGAGYLLQSTHTHQFLTANEDTQAKWSPWFEGRHAHLSQQWVLALPYGLPPKK